eukprot:CAMPEP_0172385632 /NCGR_PEP_ID=MMETSP1061-20121228/3270_1 /TAXON_ID=37318 /ORGANISM="Pseudo-nitzschia pungens, Strain cf. pungens" /LENGTH=544 /DNA_ID=CAMNT_0013114721 /DNA_START=530 /DNA_END=2164 /DNA_ORIENTATION=+
MTALFAYRSIDDDDHHHDDAGGSSSSSSSLDCARSNPSTACSTITDALLHRPRKTTANTSTKIPGTPTTVRCYSEEEEEEYLYSDNLHEEFFVPSIDDSPPPVARGAILRPVLRDPFPVVDADADADADANISHATNPTSTIRLHRTAPPLLPVFPTRARGPVLTGSQSNKEDSVNRTDNDNNDNDNGNDNDNDAWIRNNSGNTINSNTNTNTNDDDTSKTICTSYYAKQRSRKQIRKLYRTTSSSNSKNNTEEGRSSSVHRKLSMTRVKDAWNTLVADRSSQSSTPASSQSGNGRRSFLPSYRSSRFYHYLRDEVETKAKIKTKTKTKSDRPRTRQHESVEPPSMPSLSSPTDGKNQNHHHNGNHHHTADGVPLSSAATTTTTTTTKTRWNQLVDGFRKEPSLSSLSAAVLLSSSATATATSTNTNTNTTPSNSINININISDCCYQSATLDPSTASAHTTCTETTDSNTCITAPGSRPSSPRLVALLQKGLYRCRNDEDEDDDEDDEDDEDDDEGEGEDEGGEDNDHPAAGSFAFAIGRGEF